MVSPSFERIKNDEFLWVYEWMFKTQKGIQILDFRLVQFSSVAQSCSTLCDPMNCSTPSLPVHHQLLGFTQTHVH